MSHFKSEIVFIVLQYLYEQGQEEAAHTLERESGLYFNMKYFEQLALTGNWEEAEHYLSGFTSLFDNQFSTRTYFQLRRQKFLEALDKNDRVKALDILLKDLKVFPEENVYRGMTRLLQLNNIREHRSLFYYQDANSERKNMIDLVKQNIEANPQFIGKLKFPSIASSHRLYQLINQSFLWQHEFCQAPLKNPTLETLFMDHLCRPDGIVSAAKTTNNSSPATASASQNENHSVQTHNNSKLCNLLEVNRPSRFRSLQLPAHVRANRIVRLTYSNVGNDILALTSNGIHLLWKWPEREKATTRISPSLWHPKNGPEIMRNDLASANPQDPISCFALSKNDSYLMSTSGGLISLHNVATFKTEMTIMTPPPRPTCLAIYPRDNNVVAIGMDDFSIVMYNLYFNKLLSKLCAHLNRVTGLAFSETLDILVSANIDSQILVWNMNGWVIQKARNLQINGRERQATHVEFHRNQIYFLAVCDTYLGIYEARELGCISQWVPEGSAVISQATFSCDGEMVYACFVDGTLIVFEALSLQQRCRINRSAYLFASRLSVYPLAIAAHPHNPTQFVVGLTDGRVFVLEPRRPGGAWSLLGGTKIKDEPIQIDSSLNL